MSLAKPQLRGLLASQIKRNLIVSAVLVTVFVTSVKFLRNEPRKRDYAEYYKTYDPEAHYQRMADAGLLQSTQTQ